MTIDPSTRRIQRLNYIPPEHDWVAEMAQALRERITERFVVATEQRSFAPSLMSADLYGNYSELQAVPVAEPATLLLLGSGIIGLATTMRRYGKNRPRG
jgi:hypothetical protein